MTSLYMPQRLWRTGFSLIPLLGSIDATRPKAPALSSWAEYQQRRASWPDIVRWVAIEGYQLAIVTGRISGVVVVDFDDLTLWEGFKDSALFPQFSTCMTVQTRRGIHLYLPVASDGSVIRSRAGIAWDLKAEGGYVVAPSSIINGHEYTITAGDSDQLGRLDEAQLAALLLWLDEQETKSAEPSVVYDKDYGHSGAPSALKIETEDRLPVEAAQGLYRTWAAQGRNNALFASARLLHDHFYDRSIAIEALIDLHVAQQPPTGHRYETSLSRQQEALRTIHSAFSRPRRATRPIAMRQLPNVIRECLNRARLTCVARVLDALRSRGYGPGTILSRRQIMTVVAGIVGHWSIRRAFDWLMTLPKTHPHSDELPDGSRQRQETICDCLGVQNHQKIKHQPKGRRPVLITVPSDEAIATFIGCRVNKASDVVIPAEQRSVKDYRATLNREYLKRRPGAHILWWLAHRVGVSKQTLKRYNRIGEIQTAPRVRREAFTRALLQRLPEDDSYADLWRNRAGRIRTPGYWLEDAHGKRYPALRVIAKILMCKGVETWLCIQGANHYFHLSQPEHARPVLQSSRPTQTHLFISDEMRAPREKHESWLQQNTSSKGLRDVTRGSFKDSKPVPDQRATSSLKRTRVLPPHNARRYQSEQANPRHEYVAQRIHDSYPAISLTSARRVVHLVGGQAVYKALAIVTERLQRGGEVHDPARLFLMTAGYSTAIRQQKEEKKRHRYRVIWPRRVRRIERQA